jgi:purine-cytosine permease-like protein
MMRFENPLLSIFTLLALIIATLSTNIAANVVSPANDFSNLWPSKINFKTGGIITGIIGILMCPWKLYADPTGYIFTWLIGYSALLGPIAGIIIADYFIFRRQQLILDDFTPTRAHTDIPQDSASSLSLHSSSPCCPTFPDSSPKQACSIQNPSPLFSIKSTPTLGLLA